ncbi:lysophospholiPASe L1 [Terrimicrobium sacchariphilum]|uniref:LysophospholiPASe L1 n=1 Tax=Terrimicrobium sacchariphilum TaxID=690879 RepID=A0A146G5J7_TERSA|nr:GDSL-type esterase/lipase family protein [Terrimicrobium sacchariphilum]GAT32663.1 lysophospholiPASe L1 [Terrimicrobium sacchariphilum]
MKQILCLAGLAGFAFAVGPVYAQPVNRLDNASFESEMINGLPDDWELFCPVAGDGGELSRAGRAAFATDESVYHGGSRAVRISSDKPTRCAVLQRSIPCQAGEKWKFSVWMKGSGLGVGGDAGAIARVSFLNPADPSRNAALTQRSASVRSESADFDWTRLETAGEVPADATVAQVELFLWKGKGTVWFDDASLEFAAPASSRAPDRAGKLRSRNANNRLTGQPRSGERVIFMGDSITEGWNLRAAFPDQDFVNRGIGGQLTWQMVSRFPQDVLSHKPDAVVILAGTNDIGGAMPPEIIVSNIRSMVEAAKDAGARVVVCSILPVTDALATPASPQLVRTAKRPPGVIREVNALLRIMAEDEKVSFVDLHQALADEHGALPATLTVDGLHLNPDGYAVISPIVLKAIQSGRKS